MDKMFLMSWNVNGIRAAIKKGFEDFLHEYDPDILCLQETKAEKEQVPLDLEGFHTYWNSAKRKGYSGTAVFTKIKPLNVHYGMNIEKHDQEGRVITLEFPDFYLVNVYTPNSQAELKRLVYRTESWDRDFLKYVKGLEIKKPVVFCGDLNVAHKEIDLTHPKPNVKNPGFTPEERKSFDHIVSEGFIDTFRYFNQEPEQYSWWSYRAKAREKNVGWRIDYFCVSESLKEKLKNAEIHQSVYGSDHCPVSLTLSL